MHLAGFSFSTQDYHQKLLNSALFSNLSAQNTQISTWLLNNDVQ